MKVILRVLAGIAIVYAGYIHYHLAAGYDGGTGLTVGDEFRAQFVAALIAAAILLVPRRWAFLPTALVAAATLAAVVASVYVHVGAIGPLPALPHEPWYTDKTYSAIAEGLALLFALVGLALKARTPPTGEATASGHLAT